MSGRSCRADRRAMLTPGEVDGTYEVCRAGKVSLSPQPTGLAMRTSGRVPAAGSLRTSRTSGAKRLARRRSATNGCIELAARTDPDRHVDTMVSHGGTWPDGSADEVSPLPPRSGFFYEFRIPHPSLAELRRVLRAGRLLSRTQASRGLQQLRAVRDRRGAQHLRELHAAAADAEAGPRAGRRVAAVT